MKKLIPTTIFILVLLILIIPVIGFLQPSHHEIPDGYLGQKIVIKQRLIRYHQTGQGQDIFLIHGSMGSLEDWESLFAPLKVHYRVTAIDRPGMGFSSILKDDASLEGNAKIAFEVIRKLDLRDVIVVGHSYGGAIALKMATEFNPTIRGYLLVAPAAYPKKGFGNRGILKLLTFPHIGEGLAVLLGPFMGARMIAKVLNPMINTNRAMFPENFVSFRQKLWNRAVSTTTHARQSAQFNRELQALVPLYPDIKHAIALIIGDQDSEELLRQSEALKKAIPGLKYYKIEGVNHYVQYESPLHLVGCIRDLVARKSR